MLIAMKAILTYFNHLREPMAAFVLDCQEVFVGRDPLTNLDSHTLLNLPEVRKDVRNLPEVVKRERREPFQVRLAETLFIGIPSDLRLARSHFAIRRAVGESGELVFLIRDLRSHCGFIVNDVRNAGSTEIQLKAGDRIHYGFEFVFDVTQATEH
jgi:hypothetical protein